MALKVDGATVAWSTARAVSEEAAAKITRAEDALDAEDVSAIEVLAVKAVATASVAVTASDNALRNMVAATALSAALAASDAVVT
jgi:hypothetical protein